MNCLSKLLCSAAHVLLFFFFLFLFFQGKVWVLPHVGKSLAKYCPRCSEKKRRYLWFYMTQIVHSNGKILFLSPMNCFYGAMLMFSFFFPSRKSSVFRHMLTGCFLGPCLLHVEKNYLSNAFPPWRHCWSISPWF